MIRRSRGVSGGYSRYPLHQPEIKSKGNNMKNEEFKIGEIVIYKAKGGPLIDVRLQQETVWLSLNQLADLFERDKSVISRHLRNVFEEKELTVRFSCCKICNN